MSDISKCTGEGCKKKKSCYRFTAPNNEYRQSYFAAPPLVAGKCEYYWPVETVEKPKNKT